MASVPCESAPAARVFMVAAFCSIAMAFHFSLAYELPTVPRYRKNGDAVIGSTAKKTNERCATVFAAAAQFL